MPEERELASQLDLFQYFQRFRAGELVRISNREYTTKEHDSLRIRPDGVWYRHKTGDRGRSALDYLIKVEEMSVVEAVFSICRLLQGHQSIVATKKQVFNHKPKEVSLRMPNKFQDNERLMQYLLMRGIDRTIIDTFIERGDIYEGKLYQNEANEKNVGVFVGRDLRGTAQNALWRRLDQNSTDIGNATGSKVECCFRQICKDTLQTIYVFEGAIDLLSFLTLQKLEGEDWQRLCCIALAGGPAPVDGRNPTDYSMPKALAWCLQQYQEIKEVNICTDNDAVGKLIFDIAKSALKDTHTVVSRFPHEIHHDYNVILCKLKGLDEVKMRHQKN